LTIKYDLKGKELEASSLIDTVRKAGDFPHPTIVRNSIAWLVLAHRQVRELSFDSIIISEEGSFVIRENRLAPLEVYVIKPAVTGDPEYPTLTVSMSNLWL